MVSVSVYLDADTRLASEPVRVEHGRVLGYLKVRTGEGEARISGTPEQMRQLAAEVERAAGQAEHLLRIEARLADAGKLEPAAG